MAKCTAEELLKHAQKHARCFSEKARDWDGNRRHPVIHLDDGRVLFVNSPQFRDWLSVSWFRETNTIASASHVGRVAQLLAALVHIEGVPR